MVYRRSQEIEERLTALVVLIKGGRHSTPSLAKALQVSEPTVNRCLAALRDRGFDIRSVRTEDGWSYELLSEPSAATNR